MNPLLPQTELVDGEEHDHTVTSRISLVDLAGSERQGPAGTSGQQLRVKGLPVGRGLFPGGGAFSLGRGLSLGRGMLPGAGLIPGEGLAPGGRGLLQGEGLPPGPYV